MSELQSPCAGRPLRGLAVERAIALMGQTPWPQSKIRAKPQRSCLGKGEAPSYRQPLQGALAEGVKEAD